MNRRSIIVATLVAACVVTTSCTTPATPVARANAWADVAPPPGVRLTPGLAFNTAADPQTRRATYTFPLTNDATTSVDVLRIGEDGSGIKLLAVAPATPFTLAPGGNRSVTLTYLITDCVHLPRSAWPLPVQTRLALRTGTVALPLQSDGRTDPWQSFMARPLCQAP